MLKIQLYAELLTAIAVHRVGDRPDRVKPRARKKPPQAVPASDATPTRGGKPAAAKDLGIQEVPFRRQPPKVIFPQILQKPFRPGFDKSFICPSCPFRQANQRGYLFHSDQPIDTRQFSLSKRPSSTSPILLGQAVRQRVSPTFPAPTEQCPGRLGLEQLSLPRVPRQASIWTCPD